MRYLFLLLLITACNPGSDHAQKVAAQALPRTTTKLQLASLRTYKVSASELAFYFRTNPPAHGGHLATYTCDILREDVCQPDCAALLHFVLLTRSAVSKFLDRVISVLFIPFSVGDPVCVCFCEPMTSSEMY